LGYPLNLALRYLGSKKRSAFISVGTAFAMLGVTLGVAALAIVMSVTGGFQEQFREKVLGVNAHVLVLKYSIDFREYRDIMKKVEHVPGVTGVAPFVINPMMVTHGDRTATGVLLKGVDPELMPKVLDLPKHITEGSLVGLRKADAKPPERPRDAFRSERLFGDHDAGAARDLRDMDLGPTDGGKESLLRAIERQIAEDEAESARLDAGAPLHKDVPPPTKAAQLDPRPDLVGDVTPDGGFASQLPEDDVLPDSIDPDPCKSPEQVSRLPGVVVGRTLAKQLAIGIGDCVQITSPTIGISIGAAGARPPIAKQFRLIAVFEAGFDQYDSKLVYTDLYEAQAFYEQGDSVTGVEMKVDDIDRAHEISAQIDKLLANGVYHTMDWKELNHGLFTALLIQQIGMSFVLALIIVVAAFTVVATLIMVVLDKKKEISLLKALGARDAAILRVFLYQGGIIGLVGTTSGLLLGYFCCKGLLAYGFPLDPKVYFISSLPVNVRPLEFGITGLVAIVICTVATIFPAAYAAGLRPSEGLRAE
jgi:lipoprotein-releasing system permease protein